MATIAEFRGVVQAAIRNHHENFDGSGYPDGLEGEQIPLGARIIMIADTIDAMTTDRPYRQALAYHDVIAEMARYSGVQFDPALVKLVSRSAGMRRLLHAEGSNIPVSGAPALPATLSRSAPAHAR